jgi:hypothetical protein
MSDLMTKAEVVDELTRLPDEANEDNYDLALSLRLARTCLAAMEENERLMDIIDRCGICRDLLAGKRTVIQQRYDDEAKEIKRLKADNERLRAVVKHLAHIIQSYQDVDAGRVHTIDEIIADLNAEQAAVEEAMKPNGMSLPEVELDKLDDTPNDVWMAILNQIKAAEAARAKP